MQEDTTARIPRMDRRKFLSVGSKSLAGALIAAPLLAACGGSKSSKSSVSKGPSKKLVLREGSTFGSTSIMAAAERYFAKRVEELSNGDVKIEQFFNSVLGSETSIFSQLRNGTIQLQPCGSPSLGAYVPAVQTLEAPYLWPSTDVLHSASPALVTSINKLAVPKGVRDLATYIDGPRETCAVRPLHSLSDFKGIKLRVPEAPIYIGLAKAFGANPTPTAFGNVYTALQTHLADAAEGSLDSLYAYKWYEPAKYIVLTDHIITPVHLTVNESYFSKLSSDVKTILQKAATDASNADLNLVNAGNLKLRNEMTKAGATFITVDKKPFEAALQPFGQSFAQSLGADALSVYNQAKALASG